MRKLFTIFMVGALMAVLAGCEDAKVADSTVTSSIDVPIVDSIEKSQTTDLNEPNTSVTTRKDEEKTVKEDVTESKLEPAIETNTVVDDLTSTETNQEDAIQVDSTEEKTVESKPKVFDIIEGEVEVGNIVRFGLYEQDGDEANGPEPIEWHVVTNNNKKIELLSVYLLDVWTEESCSTFLSDAKIDGFNNVYCSLGTMALLLDSATSFEQPITTTIFVTGPYANPLPTKSKHAILKSPVEHDNFSYTWTVDDNIGICSRYYRDEYLNTTLGKEGKGFKPYYTPGFRPMITIKK